MCTGCAGVGSSPTQVASFQSAPTLGYGNNAYLVVFGYNTPTSNAHLYMEGRDRRRGALDGPIPTKAKAVGAFGALFVTGLTACGG